MKKLFMTGLVLILPLTITLLIVAFLVNFLTKPFTTIVQSSLVYYGLISAKHTLLLLYVSKILVILFLFFFTLGLGFVARLYLHRHLVDFNNWIFNRIPVVNKVYKAVQEVVQSLFASKKNSFQQVVLVPFPSSDSNSIGLISQWELAEESDPRIKDHVAVLVPGTPNPTMGFVLLFHKEKIKHLDMKVEDALKALVSVGMIFPDFSAKSEKG